MFKKIILSLVFGIFFITSNAYGAELLADKQEVFKAEVTDILSETVELIPGTDTKGINQKIRFKFLDGDNGSQSIEINNDYVVLKKGQIFYVVRTISGTTGKEYYVVGDVYRLPWLLFFIGFFIVLVCIFGGVQGLRGILSLFGSLIVIAYVLLPGILHGISPIFLTITCSSVIIILGSYITHGFNRTTSAAVIGMLITIIFTGLFAWFAVKVTSLSGFDSHESIYLNLNTEGRIDFVGLLFGGIMIGLLGVLYDVAIGQAVSVEELYRAGISNKKLVYKRGIRIGREHIGALVDTLAIAYVGASLPTLLLFYGGGSYLTPAMIMNRELFAAEIIRTIVGSIGLVLAVPMTTIISVIMLEKFKDLPHIEGQERLPHAHSH